MRRAPAAAWLLLGAALAALLALSLFGGQTASPSTHSSTSDAADGTSALYRATGASGRPTARLLAGVIGRPHELLFIFSPSQPYSLEEARAVRRFVSGGGVLVYASEAVDPALEGELGLVRAGGSVRDLVAYAPGPLLAGVDEVSGGSAAEPFSAELPAQVPILRGPVKEVLALEMRVGSGLVIALADPLILCNGNLLRSDNSRFAADLLGLAPAGGYVAFDESHHAAVAPPAPTPPSGAAPWIIAIIWAVIAGYIALALRGRGFGPPIPLAPPRARSSAEYVDAVGTLLRRAGGRHQALEILVKSTRLRVGRRSPALSSELDAVAAQTAGASERELLDAARTLHQIVERA
ncbi:MAG TPA: DUF4350 domain-containing protein [Candidatus Dormibacteraeota bacterium]